MLQDTPYNIEVKLSVIVYCDITKSHHRLEMFRQFSRQHPRLMQHGKASRLS
ncbi:MAG TPA: hypothetical protein VMV75_08985 [Sulfuricella sp.]|nr:hypothetical protein [Sulfuricella sp.]